jgi:hypothetical protein
VKVVKVRPRSSVKGFSDEIAERDQARKVPFGTGIGVLHARAPCRRSTGLVAIVIPTPDDEDLIIRHPLRTFSLVRPTSRIQADSLYSFDISGRSHSNRLPIAMKRSAGLSPARQE